MEDVILYKLDSKGKIRMLSIGTNGDEIVQISGLLNGNCVTNRSKCVAKNVGRTNATTAEQQAVLEALAKIELKIKEGYVRHISDVKVANEIMRPMLAQEYKLHNSKIDWSHTNVATQPKFDGMRCLAVIQNGTVKLWSRTGNQITTCDHIIQDLIGLEDQILDGELYVHGETFQENMRLIKKYRAGETEKIKYHVYDMIEDTSVIQRIGKLVKLISSNDFKHIVEVPTLIIENEADLKANHTKYLSEGYEGTIIRHGVQGYEMNKRSYSLLKYKDFLDEAYKLVDIIPSESRPDQGIAVCVMPDGRTFKANPKMSHEERRELLKFKDRYIDQMAEVRFFEFSEDGIPRFPVMIGFRLDK